MARNRLPAAVKIIPGDAANIDILGGPFDIVLQSTVFKSILDKHFQHKLADKMWDLTKVGGGVLWYDFVYDNPSNPDVKGVPLRQVQAFFKSEDTLLAPDPGAADQPSGDKTSPLAVLTIQFITPSSDTCALLDTERPLIKTR